MTSGNGTGQHDEINTIIPGGTYGWPVSSGLTGAIDLATSCWRSWIPSGWLVRVSTLVTGIPKSRVLVCSVLLLGQ